MANRLLLTALGLIYAMAAVWLVHNRAESYRRSLRDRRGGEPIASSANIPAPDEPKAPESAPPPSDEPKPAVVEPKTLVAQTPPAPTVVPRPKPREDDPPAKLAPLVIAGIADLSAADEAQLGRLLHELILTNHPADDDSPFAERSWKRRGLCSTFATARISRSPSRCSPRTKSTPSRTSAVTST